MQRLHRRLSQRSLGIIFPNLPQALQAGGIFDSISEMMLRGNRLAYPPEEQYKVTSDAARFRRLREFEKDVLGEAKSGESIGNLKAYFRAFLDDWQQYSTYQYKISDLKCLGNWSSFYGFAYSYLDSESESEHHFGHYLYELCQIEKELIRQRHVDRKIDLDRIFGIWHDYLLVPDDLLVKARPYFESADQVDTRKNAVVRELSAMVLVQQYLHLAVLLEHRIKLLYVDQDAEDKNFIHQFMPSMDEKEKYKSAIESMFVCILKNSKLSSWNKLAKMLAEAEGGEPDTMIKRLRRWRNSEVNVNPERLSSLLGKASFLMPSELIYTARLADFIASECYKNGFSERWLVEQCSFIDEHRDAFYKRLSNY